MRRFRAAAAFTALALVAVGCGGEVSTTESSVAGSPDDASESIALAGVFDTVSGSQLDLGSLEGQDTVLWFWAPW